MLIKKKVCILTRWFFRYRTAIFPMSDPKNPGQIIGYPAHCRLPCYGRMARFENNLHRENRATDCFPLCTEKATSYRYGWMEKTPSKVPDFLWCGSRSPTSKHSQCESARSDRNFLPLTDVAVLRMRQKIIIRSQRRQSPAACVSMKQA